jgi:hypothetical protein|tara:strand:- start:2811 stop:4538 length:1728 start_codon:yes stop_codon:yes gene_type:complete
MAKVFKRIFNQGITKRPYKAHKRYEVTDANYSSSFGISTFRAISPFNTKIEVSKSKHQGVEYDTTTLTGSGAISTELNKIPQKIVWSSIKQSCFKDYGHMKLYATASVVSIPQLKYGLGIKPESVTISDFSRLAGSASLHLSESKYDNSHGHLYDTAIDHTKFVDKKYLKFYLGFNLLEPNTIYKLQKDEGPFGNNLECKNVTIVNGITTTGEVSSSGYGAFLQTSSSLYVPAAGSNTDFFNAFENWSISAWIKLPPSQSMLASNRNTILAKAGQEYNPYLDYNPSSTKTGDTFASTVVTEPPSFPFKVSVFNQTAGALNGKLQFQFFDGREDKINSLTVTSSKVNDNQWHNIIVNHTGGQSGGTMKFYVDGVQLDDFGGTHVSRPIGNEQDVVIMCKNGLGDTGTSGSIDEIRFYNTNLTADNISSLSNNHVISGSAYQTRECGYTFYDKGLIVVTDPRPKYQNCFLGDGNFNYTGKGFEFTYNSTKKIEQQSILCEIGRGEFNVSQNNTLRLTGDESGHVLRDFVTGSDFRPYITSIGLYNDNGELLAIGKMGSPMKKRQDVDVTVDVRLDFE